jgi:TPP-dependent pyruvate/acetoin dehydrogenase alpha subunit
MTQFSKSFLINLYRKMLEIRLTEESFIDPILRGEVRCPVHLYSGEEAVAVGVCAALEDKDYIFGNHRSHGHFLAKGGKIRDLVAEIYGKETGCSRGRGGSMHLIDPEVGMLGGAPIVAGTISLAVGAALATVIRNDNRVCVTFFGDGATNEGVLFESMNFASLKTLPVIFVCENNLYATHMPIAECRPACNIVDIARPFGITSACVDGNDVLEVYETAIKAVKLCKSGQGPFFMEALTYRFRGHVGPDDNIQGAHTDIRPPEELEMWKKKDPIDRFEKRLLSDKVLNDWKIAEIKSHVHQTIENAHAFSSQSPYPKESELNAYVFKK